MILKNDYDKTFIELTEDKFIYNGWFGKRKLDRDKIRGAVIDDNYILKLLYDKNIKTYYVGKIKFSERFQLQELVNVLNEDNTLIGYSQTDNPRVMVFFLMYMAIVKLFNFETIVGYLSYNLVLILIFGWPIFNSYTRPTYDTFIYNTEEKVIKLRSTFTKKKKTLIVGKDNFDLIITSEKQFQLRINNKKNIQIPSKINYPLDYKQALYTLYRDVNPQAFNNDEITFCYYCGADNKGNDICPSCGKDLNGMPADFNS